MTPFADVEIHRRLLARLALHGWEVQQMPPTATKKFEHRDVGCAIQATIDCRGPQLSAEYDIDGRRFLSRSSAELRGDDDAIVDQFNAHIFQYSRVLAMRLCRSPEASEP